MKEQNKSSRRKASAKRNGTQIRMFRRSPSAYGGDLLKTREGRRHGRPLSTRESMHLVLRSTKARGEMSFRRRENDVSVRRIIAKFSSRYGVRILSLANVGNHLHIHLRLTTRHTYASFIRAVTGGIAMAVGGRSLGRVARRAPKDGVDAKRGGANVNDGRSKRFWDRRPFTRIVHGMRDFLNVEAYVAINQLEAGGCTRADARIILEIERLFANDG